MRYLILIIITVILISCAYLKNIEIKKGIYVSSKPDYSMNNYEEHIYTLEQSLNDTLKLYDNMGFEINSKYSICYGTYIIDKDSLILDFDSLLKISSNKMYYKNNLEILLKNKNLFIKNNETLVRNSMDWFFKEDSIESYLKTEYKLIKTF